MGSSDSEALPPRLGGIPHLHLQLRVVFCMFLFAVFVRRYNLYKTSSTSPGFSMSLLCGLVICSKINGIRTPSMNPSSCVVTRADQR